MPNVLGIELAYELQCKIANVALNESEGEAMIRMGKITGQLVNEYFNEKKECTQQGCDHRRESTSLYCRRHENKHLMMALAALATTAVSVVLAVLLIDVF